MAPEGQWEVGGTGKASGSAGILPDLMPPCLSFPFCQLATILTAAPATPPVTLSIFLFRGLTPAIKGAPWGVEAGPGRSGGLTRLDCRPPPHPFWTPPSSWVRS